MIKKIQTEAINIFGISLLLLASFYFYKFSVFAVPDIFFILSELFKILVLLLFVNLGFIFTQNNKFRDYFLFIFLIFLSIFFLKLLFNISGNISLHFFLKKIYSSIFGFKIDGKIPLFVKILSYITPFIIISFILFILRKKLKKIKKFFVIFGFFISLVVVWDLIKIFDKQKMMNNNHSKIEVPSNQKSKKVLWLLFDGLDPEYINYSVNKKKLFSNLNYLKDNGVFHENMFPPSNWTLYSMPSQLMGINITNMIPKHETLIFQTLDNKFVPFNFENSIFGNVKNLGYDVSLISSVLEYCSAYLISKKWNICEDVNSQNKSNVIFLEATKFYFSIIFKFRIFLSELEIITLNPKNSLINASIDKNLPKININDLDFNNLSYDNNFSIDHTNLINLDKILNEMLDTSFMYVHIYNPHLFNNSENFIKNNLMIDIQEIDPYILKYFYIDLFIKNLLLETKKNELYDLLLIVSSDHWNRDKDISKKEKNAQGEYVGNSYFSAKFLNDDSNYFLNKPANSIIIKDLIENFYKNKISNNEDIYNFISSSKKKIHTLIKN